MGHEQVGGHHEVVRGQPQSVWSGDPVRVAQASSTSSGFTTIHASEIHANSSHVSCAVVNKSAAGRDNKAVGLCEGQPQTCRQGVS